MTRSSIRAACVVVLAGTLGVSSPARALGPVDLEAAVQVGYGTNPTGYAPNPLGLELGGRAGVSFWNIYAGASFAYSFGGTTQGNSNVEGLSGPETLQSFRYGLELGYNFKIPVVPVTIRPQLGAGDYVYMPSGVGFCGQETACSSSDEFYLQPGVVGLIAYGHFIAGVDVNAFIIPEAPTTSGTTALFGLTVHGQVGVRF
jgi:hypothetical protein